MFTDLSHRAFLFALCSFIMCACFTTCYLAQNRAEIFFRFCPRPNTFSRSALQVIDSRPRVTLPSAASSATCGREQHEQRSRVDNFSLSHEGPDRVVAEICRRRSVCPLPTRGEKAGRNAPSLPWPNAAIPALSPFSTTLPQPLFFCHHHLQPTKRKINFKKNDKLLPEINN